MTKTKPKADLRPVDLVVNRETGELFGRVQPLTQREKVERFDLIRRQSVTVDLARRAHAAAKIELKERATIVEREEGRLYDLTRKDADGNLFPVTSEEIDAAAARVRALIDPEPPREFSPVEGVSVTVSHETAAAAAGSST